MNAPHFPQPRFRPFSFRDAEANALRLPGEDVAGPRDIWSAVLPAGTHVHCDRGVYWLTEENGVGDVILHPGESHTVRRPGKVVVQTIVAGEFDVGADAD